MVNVAMYDAVNGLTVKSDRRTPALVALDGSAGGTGGRRRPKRLTT